MIVLCCCYCCCCCVLLNNNYMLLLLFCITQQQQQWQLQDLYKLIIRSLLSNITRIIVKQISFTATCSGMADLYIYRLMHIQIPKSDEPPGRDIWWQWKVQLLAVKPPTQRHLVAVQSSMASSWTPQPRIWGLSRMAICKYSYQA